MKKYFELNIVTAGNSNISDKVVSMITETKDGRLEVLPDFNQAFISTIPTTTEYTTIDGDRKKVFTSNGIMYIKDNQVKFCCDYIEKA